MKARRTLGVGMLSVSLALAGVALSAPAAWAFSGFAFIKGAKQGLIQGDVTSKIASGAINLVAIGAEALLPVDPLTGKVTGTLQIKPFQIVKNPDKATVKLLNALLTSETLTVEIRLFRPDVTGVDVLFHTIQLQNAVISDFNLSGNPNGTVPLNEVVSFTYQTISFTDLNGNVSILSISP